MQRTSLRLASSIMTVSRRSANNVLTSSSLPKSFNKNVRIFSSSSSAAPLVDQDIKHHPNALKPWPQPLVESHGDYRAEAFLETHIGGPLYEHQAQLPRLPIPSISATLDRFLPTALPLAKNDQERESLLQACRDFEVDAQPLQARLQEHAANCGDTSWLQRWWNTCGYLQVRDPVVINVSYFFHFSDDGTLPPDKPWNVTRGASMLFAAAEYRKLVCSGTLPVDSVGKKRAKTTLCSAAYKYMFHACRIPRLGEDQYDLHDPSLYTHCVVARKGQFFAVEMVHPETAEPLPLAQLEDSLAHVVQLADDRHQHATELGWLTGSHRDDWAEARAQLLRVGGLEMERALHKLESGALLLCLDDQSPVSRKQCGELFWHGTARSGGNRWFDKSVQLVCTDNGKAGLVGEHSMMDGMPVVGLAHHITRTTYAAANERSSELPLLPEPNGDEEPVENIFGGVYAKLEQSEAVQQAVDKARNDLDKLVSDHELDVQSFQAYGSNFIKRAGFSPDAYVQMAMQVATFRLFGEQVGTYEATQMRPFLHGRTETTRTVSTASHAFCRSMGPRPKRDERDETIRREKLALLRHAADAHVEYIGKAAKGEGVDRHFFGLQMVADENNEAPALFGDAVFQRSKRWRVSTSHLTHPKFENWGYGEVVPDGVGLAYAIKADCCIFNITALKEHQWTDRLSHLLEEALLEMRDLVEADAPPRSKL